MLYSVFNWGGGPDGRGGYDVFESRSGEANGQRPKPRRQGPGPKSPGQQLESLLPVLPRDAVKIRSSAKPVGRIAIHYSSPAVGLGFAEYDPSQSPLVTSPWKTLVIGGIGVLLGFSLLKSIAKKL